MFNFFRNSKQKAKTLQVSNVNQAKKLIKDLQVFGDGDTFKLISKASSQEEGWMKSTKAMQISGNDREKGVRLYGCVVQVTTQQRNPDGSYALAEAVTFVPGAKINEVFNNEGIVIQRTLTL